MKGDHGSFSDTILYASDLLSTRLKKHLILNR